MTRRQPLKATTDNTISFSRRRSITNRLLKNQIIMTTNCNGGSSSSAKQKQQPQGGNTALSLMAAGRENHRHQLQKQQQSSSSRLLKAPRSKKGGLLGSVFQRAQRVLSSSSSSSSSSRNVTSFSSTRNNNNSASTTNVFLLDPSQTTVQSNITERTTPTVTPPQILASSSCDATAAEDDELEAARRVVSDALTPRIRQHRQQQKEEAATIILQTLVRGYLQRYAYQMMKFRHRLQHIKKLKDKQLAKLTHRTKMAKKAEKSSTEFGMGELSRRLGRTTRVVPYLFRQAQTQLQENVDQLGMLGDCSYDTTILQQQQHLKDLNVSHMNLQVLAHGYLESMEAIPGIWGALKAQWMGPKRGRVRRAFGSDGKSYKLVQVLCSSDDGDCDGNTQGQDVAASRATTTTTSKATLRRAKSDGDANDRQQQHEGHAMMAELYLSRTQQVGESISQVQAMAAGVLLN